MTRLNFNYLGVCLEHWPVTSTILKRIRKEITLKTLITFWTSLSVTAFSSFFTQKDSVETTMGS